MIKELSPEAKLDILCLFLLEKRARDLSELRLATRKQARAHTMCYRVTCHSLWEDHGEQSVTEEDSSLEVAVARCITAFTTRNKRNDGQIRWSANCTVARKDGTWSLTCPVPHDKLMATIPKQP
jgi:hypothetical protein